MKLEAGALYKMDNGKIERCGEDRYTNRYWLGNFIYSESGMPPYITAPQILYKLRVNEPPEPETPKPIPFKIDGPGWYRLRLGSWVKLTLINGWFRNWDEYGVSRLPWALSDVITKATPEQARILDAL